ncbi:MAG: pilus assembly protein [Myxococcaceae bacterium]|nr:pilus assembly protein [Myxococcaceae bacterium]
MRGQAAVETALTLPLMLFMVLGTLQLFLLLQARLLTEHAAFSATRTGALSSGRCTRMVHAALLTVLPSFTRTDSPGRVANGFRMRSRNRFDVALDSGHDREIVWLYNEVPGMTPRAGGPEDDGFDDPDRAQPLVLETRLVFWYPMRVPFANWVIARSVLAAWGGARYQAVNPLSPTQTADWRAVNRPATVTADVFNELDRRVTQRQYTFPIQATSAMRMLTSPRQGGRFLTAGVCR